MYVYYKRTIMLYNSIPSRFLSLSLFLIFSLLIKVIY